MKLSYPNKGTTVVSPADGRDLARKVQAVILPFRLADVADAADRTTEAVKKWRRADTCPDLPSAINLARGIPAIKWLIYQEIESGAPEGVLSPKLVVSALALLQQIANGNTEHAAAARAIISGQGADR